MADAGLRKHGAQAVEDRLVGDFAGETNITRRDFPDLGRHQRAAPMRRRARQMRHAAAAEPGKMIGDRLAGARQHQRRAADDRAQKYLQAAIAADVVERAPDDGAVETSGADRRDQAGQAVHRHLRHAGRAGREQYPFGQHMRQRLLFGRGDGRRTNDAHRKIECRVVQRTRVDHDGVGLGTGDQSGQVIGRRIGRQNRHAARHAVELDQRQRRRELARRRDHNRAVRKLGKAAAKTCSARQMVDAKPRRAIPEELLRRSIDDATSKRRRVAAHFHTLSRSRRASAGTWRPRRP